MIQAIFIGESYALRIDLAQTRLMNLDRGLREALMIVEALYERRNPAEPAVMDRRYRFSISLIG